MSHTSGSYKHGDRWLEKTLPDYYMIALISALRMESILIRFLQPAVKGRIVCSAALLSRGIMLLSRNT